MSTHLKITQKGPHAARHGLRAIHDAKFKWLMAVALVAASGVFATPTPAQAAIMSTITQIDADESVVGDISGSDLINTGSAALSGVSSSNYGAQLGANGSPDGVLNDGLHGYRSGMPSLGAASNEVWTITYTLNAGYDIDSIVVHTGAEDFRADQDFEVFFETVGDPGNFVSIGRFTDPTFRDGRVKTTVFDDTSSPIGTNVSAVRFDIYNSFAGVGFYSELDVFEASPVPEPSSFVLAGLGLLGLAGWGVRRRREA